MPEANPRKAAEEALKRSFDAARRNDLAAAERWSKTAERMAAAVEKLPPSPDDPEEEERLREEIRARIMVFVEAHNDVVGWEEEARAYVAAVQRGEAVEPLRPHPAGPVEQVDALERIRAGGAS